ncbi:hypothetical protein [Enterococcus faecium]|uniref:hypothetical protein n=1 Tax=Enterococcus faecium TaxID=1352 RepID=UPI000BF21740|nr:hypothetical protein [Enterococcus faecium]PEH49697.1 hypothetical protein CRM75_00650 [Enterococcus faecium]
MISILSKKKETKEDLIKSVDVFLVKQYLQTKCQLTTSKKGYSFAFYVYQQDRADAIYRSDYSSFDTNQIKLVDNGEYRVKVFVKNNTTNEIKTMMSSPIQKTTVINF